MTFSSVEEPPRPRMQLTPGSQLGPFRIIALQGIGGMGEVYRAEDTRLGREVALKVLPGAFAHDRERASRFEREARILASLNHPNIATLHGVSELDGRTVLEMELVPGETLGERVQRGRITVEEVLSIFKQIAHALEAAHERGVIHRDLKPANIKITTDGRVKVLDFGLAKAYSGGDSSSGLDSETNLITVLTTGQSQPGMIVGTARYMSPEQARGQALDKRTDIWSYGCLLYEVLAGKAPFIADTGTDTLAAILKEEPDWGALSGPAPLQRLARRCLRKDAQSRLRDIADARLEIEELQQDSAPMRPLTFAGVTRASRRNLAVAVLLALALLATGAVTAWLFASRPVVHRSPARVVIALPAEQQLALGPSPSLAVSPDGRRLVYVAAQPGSRTQLYLRPIDRFDASVIPGTEGASAPFFSADGSWVGFYAGDAIQKVSLDGGAPLKICDAPPVASATWGRDDRITFATTLTGDGLWRVPADGGEPERLTTPDPAQKELHHMYPQVLPGGGTAVFTVLTDQGSFGAVLSLESRQWRRLSQVRPTSGGVQFVSTGHLVAAQANGLVAVVFDPASGETRGSPIPISERMAAPTDGGTAFAVAESGTLVYVPGRSTVPRRTLVTVDRDGRSEPLSDLRTAYSQPRFSPDGRWLAMTIESEAGADVWVLDLQRDTRTRLTTGDAASVPVWSPDAMNVGFHASRLGAWNLYARVADGSRAAEPLLTGPRPEPAAAWSQDPGEKLLPGFVPALSGANPQYPMSWTPDGQTLVFAERKPNGERDIWVVERGTDPAPFLLTPFDEWSPAFSPDGSWLAYVSDESGRAEVYLQPYPGPGGRWLISTGGGTDPVWAKDGHELYYLQDDQLMSVPIQTAPAVNVGAPRRLFEGHYERSDIGRNYDLSPDGKRFVMIRSDEREATPRMHVVLNWIEELGSRTSDRSAQ